MSVDSLLAQVQEVKLLLKNVVLKKNILFVSLHPPISGNKNAFKKKIGFEKNARILFQKKP